MSTGEEQLWKSIQGPKHTLIQLLTPRGFLADQERGGLCLRWDGKGVRGEFWLLTAVGGPLVASVPHPHNGSLRRGNPCTHCVPDVLIAIVV